MHLNTRLVSGKPSKLDPLVLRIDHLDYFRFRFVLRCQPGFESAVRSTALATLIHPTSIFIRICEILHRSQHFSGIFYLRNIGEISMPVTCHASRYIVLSDICDMKILKKTASCLLRTISSLHIHPKSPNGPNANHRDLFGTAGRVVLHIGLVLVMPYEILC